MKPITVGVIGIGNVGLPIAEQIAKAGFDLVGFNRSAKPAFEAVGGRQLETAAEVVRAADFVLLCLPDKAALWQVLYGDEGVLSAVRQGQLLIEMGTYKRETKLEEAAAIGSRGARILEAEVSGSPHMIRERKASLFLGGDPALVEAARPVLEAIADTQFQIGEFGSAVSMKLIANYLVSIHTLAAAEAMHLGKRAGFAPEHVVDVISKSAGGSVMFGLRAPLMANRRFTPAPGPFRTLEKYLDLAEEMAGALGCTTPLFSTATPYFRQALESGMGDEDIAAVIKLIEAKDNTGDAS